MLIPKQMGEVARVASTDKTRGALKDVHLERDDEGKPYAVAVDGRQMVVATWQEPPSDEWPNGDGKAFVDQVHGFGVNLDAGTFQEFTKQIAANKKAPGMLGSHGLVEENPNGTVHMKTTDLKTTRALECVPDPERFPSWREVIPKYNVVTASELSQLVENSEEGDLDFSKMAVSIVVNPEYLKVLSEIIGRLVANSVDHAIRVTVPIMYGKPLVLDSVNAEETRGALAVLMPMRWDRLSPTENALERIKTPAQIDSEVARIRLKDGLESAKSGVEGAVECLEPGEKVVGFVDEEGRPVCWKVVASEEEEQAAEATLKDERLPKVHADYYEPVYGRAVEFKFVCFGSKEPEPAPEPEQPSPSPDEAVQTADSPLVDDDVLDQVRELNVPMKTLEMLTGVARNREHLLSLIRSFASA